jgi:3-methyladenine DNA glycosylase Mpg
MRRRRVDRDTDSRADRPDCAKPSDRPRPDDVQLDRGPLRILQGVEVPDEDVAITPRIGIRKAADWPLRFVLSGNPFVSR